MVRHSRQHERKDRNAKNVGSLATWQTETLRVNNNNNSLSPQETFLPLTDNMINRTVKSFLLACVTLLSANAFAPTGVSSRRATPMMAVVDIDGEAAFDKTIQSAGSSLVVVDYSTTWCGPCKVIAPKFDELSEKYTDAVFLKVIGDASPDASKLMKREGVRSVPSFHYFKDGEKVDVVNGANAEAIEAAITKHS